VTAKERGTYAVMHKYCHNNFSVSKQTAMGKPANKVGLLYIKITNVFSSKNTLNIYNYIAQAQRH
jgi:hypothetical protein